MQNRLGNSIFITISKLIYLCLRSKKRETVSDLAPLLWHSFGTVTALLQEIINIYPAVNPAVLTAGQSNRVCNALALLQVSINPKMLTISSGGTYE